MLHLVSGAVLKDHLERTLLVLTDLHFLAARGVDWQAVWSLAGETGLRRPLALLAAVASRFGARWVPATLAHAAEAAGLHVAPALGALVRKDRVNGRAKVVDSVTRASRGRGLVRGALSLALAPEPMQLARIAGLPADSRWRWVAYPAWLLQRTAAFVRGSAEERRLDSPAARRMRGWLAEE